MRLDRPGGKRVRWVYRQRRVETEEPVVVHGKSVSMWLRAGVSTVDIVAIDVRGRAVDRTTVREGCSQMLAALGLVRWFVPVLVVKVSVTATADPRWAQSTSFRPRFQLGLDASAAI